MKNFVAKEHLVYFLAVMAALLFLGTWRLSASPATWFDEGINIGIAQSFARNGVYNLSVGPDQYVAVRQFLITTNYPVLLPVALSIRFFGMSIWAARIPMVIFLVLFALSAYALVRKMYGEKSALWSLALIVSFVPFYGNGKDVLGEVPGLFFLLAGLLTLPEGRNWKRLMTAGFLFGLSIAAKPFFLLILPALFLGEIRFAGWNFMAASFWKRFAGLSAGAAVPVLGWLYTILPDASVAGIVTAIRYYSNSYASTDIWNLVVSNIVRFVTETTPLHFFLMSLLIGIAVMLRLKKNGKLDESELVIFTFILLNFLWYLKTPGWYRYFFPAHLLLFLFLPEAVASIFNRRLALIFMSGLLLIQAGYLLTKRSDPLYNSDETIRFSDYVMAHTAAGSAILSANAPSVAFLLSDRAVYQYLQINPGLFFGRSGLISDKGTRYDYVVVNRPVENILMPNLQSELAAGYTLEGEVGHYMLYKKNNGKN